MLYFVGTPIGNLEDISYRQAKILTSSDTILAEDTRSAQTLLHAIQNLFNLKSVSGQKLISYYKEKEFDKLPYVLNDLKEDKIVSLVTEAGMPIISDPGFLLVKTVIQQSIPYEVIPGPSAVTTALVHSGLKSEKFMLL
jgi:16S rRNA (cytidine1402-2'-O)-methyltransferase